MLPAAKRDVNLCRAIVSASALDYPTPAIVGWEREKDEKFHVSKIVGIEMFLNDLTPRSDDDLVIIADGTQNWFQLRPQVLLDRYYAINERADARIGSKLGRAAYEEGISQQIVFLAQKKCSPWTANDPPCYAVPESTLPKDINGIRTDVEMAGEQNPYKRIRPRYLSSGVAIGPVWAMRRLFTEAAARARHDPQSGTDDEIFGQIFAEQELYRELMRQQYQGAFGRFASWLSALTHRRDDLVSQHLHVVEDLATQLNRSLEYGIGLDYESNIGLATAYAEDDTEYLTRGDLMQVRAAAQERKIDPSRVEHLQDDISVSLPPFWTFQSRENLPRERAWKDVPLFTDMRTGNAPAIINHDAKDDGLEQRRAQWWPKTWFHEHAREIFSVHLNEPVGPVAIAGPKNGNPREWWAMDNWRGGVRHVDGHKGDYELYGSGSRGSWFRYEDICTGTENDVFGDGKGAWYLPAEH